MQNFSRDELIILEHSVSMMSIKLSFDLQSVMNDNKVRSAAKMCELSEDFQVQFNKFSNIVTLNGKLSKMIRETEA